MSYSTPKWTFHLSPKLFGMSGEAFTNIFAGMGTTAEERLAREVIQNSCDAARSDREKVAVYFSRVDLQGESKKLFFDTLGVAAEYQPRKNKLGIKGSCLDSLNDHSSPLPLLFIDDYNTFGLSGHPHDDKSNFKKLLFSFGDGSKAHEDRESGGSYGYGKSVLAENSKIQTIIVYTVIDPEKVTDGIYSRLMGCGYFKKHDFNKKSYSGCVTFGCPGKEDQETNILPLENEDADRMAVKLGFARAGKKKSYGTSILIIDCHLTLELLKKSIEEWWWPRLVDDQLDVHLMENGKQLEPPRPKKRQDLLPFIQCYDLALGRVDITDRDTEDRNEFNKLQGKSLGKIGLKAFAQKACEDNGDTSLSGCVALIRQPKMVVEYEKVIQTESQHKCFGTFVADKEMDFDLRLSEPPMHNKWDARSMRLKYSNDAFAPERVAAIHERIKRKFREFSNKVTPKQDTESVQLKTFEKLFSKLFPLSSSNPVPANSSIPGADQGFPGSQVSEPITIQFSKNPFPEDIGSQIHTAGALKIGLKPDFLEESANIELAIQCSFLEESTVSYDSLPMSVEVDDDQPIKLENGQDKITLQIYKGKKRSIKFQSDPYDPNWAICIKVSATIREKAHEQ